MLQFIIGANGEPLQRFDQATSWEDIDKYISEHLPVSEEAAASGAGAAADAEEKKDGDAGAGL